MAGAIGPLGGMSKKNIIAWNNQTTMKHEQKEHHGLEQLDL